MKTLRQRLEDIKSPFPLCGPSGCGYAKMFTKDQIDLIIKEVQRYVADTGVDPVSELFEEDQ